MNKLLPAQILGLIFCLGVFVVLSSKAWAVSIAEQTQEYSSSLTVWQLIQELGSNLSGTAQSFTFRVSTARSNQNQFDYTAENSKIYDKSNNNSYIAGCVPTANPSDPLRGLTFNISGVPAGNEDVTIDFSCRNYDFIPGHKYLIKISNANMGNSGSGQILLAGLSYFNKPNSDYFADGGLRYANGNKFDFQNNSGSCNPSLFTWNSINPFHNGCFVWTTAKDDLYFILTNSAPPPPPPKMAVIFIPGIGGSEFKAGQQIFWSAPDGHNGTYSHAYEGDEKIWVNQSKAAELGDDDYFDVLRLKADGATSEAAISLTGELTSFGYSEIDPFFAGMGYVKEINFFVFPYDWRKDVRTTKDDLDSLIEEAKQKSGQSKVNLVVHSLGGLIARYYISDANKAAKVNKLIELGVPHLGAVEDLKTLMYGLPLGKPILKIFNIGIAASESKDVFQNFTSGFQLLPSNQYYNFYNNSDNDHLYPFRDDRDIDNNKVTGVLNYDQTKSLLSNLSYNMTAFGISEQFHNNSDSILNQTNNVKVYAIVGSSQPTLGQIFETWWITWPINLIPKTDEIYINGDDTVPLYSASLKSDSLDLSGADKIYYVQQRHADLVSQNGTAMQTVKAILNDDNSLPVEVKDQKIVLEGEQISLDDGELDLYDGANNHCGLNDKGEVEENIPGVTCTTSGNTRHAFVKKKAAKVKVKATRKQKATSSKTTTVKKRTYKQDKISKTAIYKDIILDEKGKIEFDLDPSADTAPSLTFYPDSTQTVNIIINLTSEIVGDAAIDQIPPATSIKISGTKDPSGVYTEPVTITLTGSDTDAGILKIEYSLDNGQTVQIYTDPFTISTPGKTTIQVKSIDKLGNEEIPQTVTLEIAPSPTPTPSPITTSTGNNSSTNTSTTAIINTPRVGFDSLGVNTAVLGIEFKNPSRISDQINVSRLLDQEENLNSEQTFNSAEQILGGLLIVSAGIVIFSSLGLIITFIKPAPK